MTDALSFSLYLAHSSHQRSNSASGMHNTSQRFPTTPVNENGTSPRNAVNDDSGSTIISLAAHWK